MLKLNQRIEYLIKNVLTILLSVIILQISSCVSDEGLSASKIELNKTFINLEVSDKDTLSLVSVTDNKVINWASSNPEVAIIGNDGIVLAKNSGNTTITATVDGVSASCELTVDLTIFLGGSANEFEAAYWKNGEINYLTTTGNDEGLYSWINSLRVLNGQIFSGGIKLEQNSILWKDDEEIIIGNGYQEVKKIAILESDIYAIVDNGKLFKYSGLGDLTLNRDYAGRTNSIFIHNDDFYTGGVTKIGEEFRPVIWKNENELILDHSEYTWITDVFVEGSDFYACGYEFLGAGIAESRSWKNTKKTYLTDGTTMAQANSIAVQESDIYIAGSQDRRPAIWKNGEIVYYTQTGVIGSINEILFHDGNLYAVGSLSMEVNSVGVVWKNGEEIFRTDIFDNAHLNCIEVK